MNPIGCTVSRVPAWIRGCLFAVALGGCGGGVDSGGTGGSATYASGPITGFGSIIVNGVRFDDGSASVDDGDGARSRDALQLGMVVEVRGSAIVTDSSGTRSSTASRISFGSEIVGPIDSVNVATGRIRVLGQAVEVKTTTVFDVSGGVAALAPGDVVEVYALFDALTERYIATRIELRSSTPSEYRLRGKVDNLNTASRTFEIGGETISYATLPVGDVPSGLAEGMLLRVRLATSRSGGAWVATRLRDGAKRPDEGSHSKLEGLISTFTSVAQFSVGGVAVTTHGGTEFPDGTGLAAGLRVEVEGTMLNGVLTASKVEIESDSGREDFDLRGPVEALDPTNQTLTVRGQQVSYSGTVEFRPSGRSAADLAIGVNVEVRATLSNGTLLQATRIEFKN
jgi:Domain of unknown function (DUF5666)